MKKETKHLIAITTAGAAEGALITSAWVPATLPASALIGGLVGGATAFSAERFMQTKREKTAPQTAPATIIGNDHTVVDVTVETTSSTLRTDVPEGEAKPIVKSSVEQVSNVPMSELSDTLTTLRSRTQANAFPAWRTTLNEKTVASTNSASVYDHAPQRVS